ncbi:mechanosensitive ion channel family protein [Halomicroarcula sp. GCM10025709]
MLSRPFAIGDWVRIGDHEGFITEITINNVRLRNLDGEHVVLPNEAVNNRTIINRSIEGKLRLRVEVGIDYDVDPDHAEAVALDALTELEEIMTQPAPQVLPARFDDSAVILELRFWVDKTDSTTEMASHASRHPQCQGRVPTGGNQDPVPAT